MVKRFFNVKISVFNSEKKKWKKYRHMAVLITDTFIYAVDFRQLKDVANDSYYADEKYVSLIQEIHEAKSEETKKTLERLFKNILEEKLDSCEIKGHVFSTSTSWKIKI